MEDVSVIIPAYNEEKYIERTLKSLKIQTHPNIEIIVVCNGCTDKTKEISSNYTIKIISLKEKNVSKSRNSGADSATGEFLVFLDADTILMPDVISNIIKQLNKEHYYGTVSGKSELNKLQCRLYSKMKNIINTFYPWSNGLIFCRKEDFVKTNGFDPEFHHGELKLFYNEISKYAKYKKLNSTYIITSQRRIESWGIKKILGFWLNANKNKEYNPIR